MTKLTLNIIEKYKLPQESTTPDWDDAGYDFTLPSGIVLGTLYMCNLSPCECDSLEGMDGYIYIETEEELVELIGLDYDQTLAKIKEANPDCDLSNYE
jgi:hypothetical protein